MFEDSERAEREALEGNGIDSYSLSGPVNTQHSAVSWESEEMAKAARQAEVLAQKMHEATQWIDGGSEDVEDEEKYSEN